MKHIPAILKKGDTIGLVCTARKIDMKDLQVALQVFDTWGLKVQLGKSIFLEENQFAGSDKARAEDFQEMMDNDNIKAIIVARGGYGTVRIIDELNFKRFQKKPKWIIGYSDITVLHSHINKHYKTATLHASMPISFSKNTDEAIESIKTALFGKKLQYTFETTTENIIGEAKGELVGGNLSVLYSLSGSKSELDTEGKILFLEDLDEYLYHIDRMLVQLKRSRKLKKLKGLLVGGFTEIKDNEIPFGKNVAEIIVQHLKEYEIPIAFGVPAGHVNDNRALILGRYIKMKVEINKSIIEFL